MSLAEQSKVKLGEGRSLYAHHALPQKVQGVNDLRRHLTDEKVGVEHSIIDEDIDHWRSRLHACIRATGGHLEYSL